MSKTTALREARELLAELLDDDLHSACVLDKTTGEPRRETMDELCRPGIEKIEAALALAPIGCMHSPQWDPNDIPGWRE